MNFASIATDHSRSIDPGDLQEFYKLTITASACELSIGCMRCYKDEHLEIDFLRGTALLDSARMVLTRKEYELLSMLAENAGEILPRDVLMMQVWGYSKEIRTRTLDVHIRRLRRKLGPHGDLYIETIFGVGYRFQRYREPRPADSFLSPLLAATA